MLGEFRATGYLPSFLDEFITHGLVARRRVPLIMRVSKELLGYGGIVLLVLGVVVGLTILSLDPNSFIRRQWARYVAELDKEIRFLFLETTGAKITRNQLLISGVLMIVAFVIEDELPLFLLPIIAVRADVCSEASTLAARGGDRATARLVAPASRERAQGDAFARRGLKNSARIIRAPIQQELDLAHQGSEPRHAARPGASSPMGDRVGSRTLSGALAAILVGRQTGGDLPRILEESAATLSEMERLEGVVRTKTAEGKSQAWVLGAIPFVLIGAIQMIDPMWLVPLTETSLGYIIIVVALVLWLAAILAARKILAVDI